MGWIVAGCVCSSRDTRYYLLEGRNIALIIQKLVKTPCPDDPTIQHNMVSLPA